MNKYIKYTIPIVIFVIIFGCSTTEQKKSDFSYLIDKEKAKLNYIDTSKQNLVTRNHVIEGSEYQQQELHAFAILEFQDAMKYDTSASIYYALAKSYKELGKYDNAISMIVKALDMQPDFIPARELLAEVYLTQYRLADAIKVYESILKLDPPNKRKYRITLAHMYEYKDQDKALELYQKELEESEDYSILLRMSMIYEDKNDTTELIETFEKMMSYKPGDPGLLFSLFSLYLDQNDYQEAINLLEDVDASVVDSDIDMFYGVLANKLLDETADTSKKYIPMYLDRIDNRFRFNWRLQVVSGYLANIVDDPVQVEEHFDQALVFADSIPEISLQIGFLYFQNEEYDKAIEIFKEHEDYFPKDHSFPFSLGLAYIQIDSNYNALEYFRKANDLSEKSIDNMTQLGLVHDRLGNYDSSDYYYEKAILLNPEDPLANNNYAYSLSERGINLDKALKMINIALKREPDNTSYLDTFGWIQYKLGNIDEAIKYIEKAASADNATAEVYEHLGDIYLEIGKKEKALETWKQGLERFPDDPALNKRIETKD